VKYSNLTENPSHATIYVALRLDGCQAAPAKGAIFLSKDFVIGHLLPPHAQLRFIFERRLMTNDY
jgi:hypothetical protein